jgi:WD40 repeat protein
VIRPASNRRSCDNRFVLALFFACSAPLACARFGFELLPVLDTDTDTDTGLDGSLFDAGLRPVSAFDAAAPAPGSSRDAGSRDAASPEPDAQARDSGAPRPPDAGQDPPLGNQRCVSWSPFDPPQLVAGLAQNNAIGPALSDDALTLLYATGNPTDVFIATRPDRLSSFSSGTALPNVNSSGTDATPFLTPDGLTLLFASDRAGPIGPTDLMLATRASTDQPFSAPSFLPGVNTSGGELLPHLSADGLRLYYCSDPPGSSGGRDLWQATRATPLGTFGNVTRVAGLNSQSSEFGPSLNSDETEAFFASDRPGGTGSMDIWRARRDSAGVAFGSPENVGEVNGPSAQAYDTDPRLSADGLELVFSSNRSGPQVLWHARRTCLATGP